MEKEERRSMERKMDFLRNAIKSMECAVEETDNYEKEEELIDIIGKVEKLKREIKEKLEAKE